MSLPSGTVTFLFTDIEGSTRLWEQHPEAMRLALARHDSLLEQAITQHNGHVFKTVGDAFCAAFAAPLDALAAALVAQQSLQQEDWAEVGSVRVRMALHTGAAEERKGDYFGPALNRVARLLSIGHGGQVLLSAVTQAQVRRKIPSGASLKEMGWHRLKDLQEPEHVYQLLHPSLPSEFPALNSLDSLPNNLPRQLSSFIGREKEIAEIKRLLSASPLVTLIGTGGCGKTRLALQVAAEVLEQYPQGVWLVELAALSDPNLLVQTIATSLGLRESPGQPLLQTLRDYLQSRTLLLVLDNCEHLIQACADLIATLLQACPHLSLLTTSREALRIGGEQMYRVPSLLAPDPDNLPKEEKDLAAIVSEYEAPRLFVERASLQKPDFAITPQNAAMVASVCHRLDGIPLAIELAAARVSVLSVEEIEARLEHRFRLLSGGSRTALPRQKTLQATLDWSYDLLSKPERSLLSRLSVFSGGWTLAAAEAVCAREDIEAWEVLDLLTSLVNKSLVIAEEQVGRSRYRMLETVRQYNRERLAQTGQESEIQGRHKDFFLAMAEEARPQLKGLEQAIWLERLEAEHDNLRAALAWCSAEEGDPSGLPLANALWRFWEVRGHLSEGRAYMTEVLKRAKAGGPTKERASVLNAAGVLARLQGDYEAARMLHEESLTLLRELEDKEGIAAALNNLGNVASELGDHRSAMALYAESLAILRQLGDKVRIAMALGNLGVMACDQEDYPSARRLQEEGLSLFRELGHKHGIATSLGNLGLLASHQGDYEIARTLQKESLSLRRELGNKSGIACSLEALAFLEVADGQPERAARLWGAAKALREAIQYPELPNEQEEYERNIQAVCMALGEEAYAATWKQGQAMTIEQAIEYALQESQQESKEPPAK